MRLFGARIDPAVVSSTSHIVIDTDRVDESVIQELKDFYAGPVHERRHFVSTRWLVDCFNQSSLLPEHDYEI
jgi:hypothetical protein